MMDEYLKNIAKVLGFVWGRAKFELCAFLFLCFLSFTFDGKSLFQEHGFLLGLLSSIPIMGFIFYKFCNLSCTLEEFLSLIGHFKSSVLGTSEQLKSSCKQLLETVEEQTDATTRTSASCHEVSILAQKNKDSFSTVNETINSIDSTMKDSEGASRELEVSLGEYTNLNKEVGHVLESVSEMLKNILTHFSEVEAKTNVINDIVFQTKLLSFNASVEAARAGEHGKGFAVVAEEIGTLAQTSGKSAQSIQETLVKAQKNIEQIVKDAGGKKIKVEKKIQEQTQKSLETLKQFQSNFNQVTIGTNEISRQVGELLSAANEQVNSIEEIKISNLNINDSTQRNSLVAGQTARLTVELGKDIDSFNGSLNEYQQFFYSDKGMMLAEIQWSDEYAIGVNAMDSEHCILLDKINELIRALNGNHLEVIHSTFVDLKNYTAGHFAREEAFMRSFSYPAYDSHVKIHKDLLATVAEFEKALNCGQLDKFRLSSFLKNWLFTHIMGVDAQYASDYFKKDHNNKLVA